MIAYHRRFMPSIAHGPKAIEQAARILREGGVVAFATETVYGLGANTFDVAALDRVYELKGRPLNNPLIAHVLDIQQAQQLARDWDETCESLARQFWPGPLTLVVPKHDAVPERATAGYDTVALRSPAHPVAQSLLKEFGGPISAPSANRTGRISPTKASHVAEDFAHVRDLLILDGGPCQLGIESTVLDLSKAVPRVLRPGSVSAVALAEALGSRVEEPAPTMQAASPGTSPRHYAPQTPVKLVSPTQLQEHLRQSPGNFVVLALQDVSATEKRHVIRMPTDADAYAAALYDSLRCADRAAASTILIESPTDQGPIWDAVRNRLKRAASK